MDKKAFLDHKRIVVCSYRMSHAYLRAHGRVDYCLFDQVEYVDEPSLLSRVTANSRYFFIFHCEYFQRKLRVFTHQNAEQGIAPEHQSIHQTGQMLPGPDHPTPAAVQVALRKGVTHRFGLELRSVLVDSKLAEVDSRFFVQSQMMSPFKFDVEKTFFEV